MAGILQAYAVLKCKEENAGEWNLTVLLVKPLSFSTGVGGKNTRRNKWGAIQLVYIQPHGTSFRYSYDLTSLNQGQKYGHNSLVRHTKPCWGRKERTPLKTLSTSLRRVSGEKDEAKLTSPSLGSPREGSKWSWRGSGREPPRELFIYNVDKEGLIDRGDLSTPVDAGAGRRGRWGLPLTES